MSTRDTMTPLLSTPWLDASGKTLPVRATLHERAHRGQTFAWLQDLSATAHAVWAKRQALALRPYRAAHSDDAIRAWLSSLPSDAYVYDLRGPNSVRGWPYGVAGPSARLYRCGRLPVFAVTGSPREGWRAGQPESSSPVHPTAAQCLEMEHRNMLRRRRRPRFQAMNHSRWWSLGESPVLSGHRRGDLGPLIDVELPQCA